MSKLMKLLGTRSPSLESVGYYDCENCKHFEYIGCPGVTGLCTRRFHTKFTTLHNTCKHFKRIIIKPLSKKRKRGLRRTAPIIDEWSGSTIIKDKEKK